MKTVKVFFLFLLLIYSFNSISQINNYEEVVYLKNGSIIHGVIIEQVPNVSLKIKTKDQNIFVFKMEEIEKITKEETEQKKVVKAAKTGIDLKQKGFMNINEIGASVLLLPADPVALFAFHTINGYLFNPHLFIGIGAGVEANDITAVIPLYLESRAYLSKGKVSPYLGLGGGYGLMYINQGRNVGGLLGHILVGSKFSVSKKAAFNFSFGYRLYQFKQPGLEYNKVLNKFVSTTVDQNSSNLLLRVGCTF